MNIRPHHHLESTWLNQDLPGAGVLDEHELDDACSRKRVINLTPDQCAAVDETAGLCGVCGGVCPSPQACEVAEAFHAQRLSLHRLRKWLPVLLGLMVALGATLYLTAAGHA